MWESALVQIITILFLTINCLYGQTRATSIQKLIDHQVIERKQVSEFEKLLKQEEATSNASYLNVLFRIEFKKLYGDSFGYYTTISYDNVKLTDDERRTIRMELSAYLSKLKTAGLINGKQLQKYQGKIDANEFFDPVHLLFYITEQVAFDEHMDPDRLKGFADTLKNCSIVTTRYDELLKAIEHEELERPIGFLKYCDKAIIINEDDYPPQPQDYLEKIHQKTAGILPELAFTDFSFQVVLDSSKGGSDSQFYYFLVSLNSNGKSYKQKSFYRLYSPEKNEYFGRGIDQQEYYNIFNRILADLQSPYRLHEVKAYNGNTVDQQTFGIIALTKEQARILHGGGVFFSPSYESFRNSLTTGRIEAAIDAYQKMGLLDHLTQEQILAAKEKVFERETRTFNDVLLCFPDVVHEFDMELANLDDPYGELVEAYSRISHREFNPTSTSDDFDLERKGRATLKFKFNNRNYERKFNMEGDWIDPEFLGFMDHVVKENSLNGQFYNLYTGGQEASVIYLTKTQHELLRANRLVVFADQWESVEEK